MYFLMWWISLCDVLDAQYQSKILCAILSSWNAYLEWQKDTFWNPLKEQIHEISYVKTIAFEHVKKPKHVILLDCSFKINKKRSQFNDSVRIFIVVSA